MERAKADPVLPLFGKFHASGLDQGDDVSFLLYACDFVIWYFHFIFVVEPQRNPCYRQRRSIELSGSLFILESVAAFLGRNKLLTFSLGLPLENLSSRTQKKFDAHYLESKTLNMQYFSRNNSYIIYNQNMPQGRPAQSERSTFGQKLYELREAKGLTQGQVAEELNIGQRSYSAWERGNIAIRPDKLKLLSSILGVTVGELVGENSKTNKNPKGKLQKVFEDVSNLPRRQQSKIVDVIEGMLLLHDSRTS